MELATAGSPDAAQPDREPKNRDDCRNNPAADINRTGTARKIEVNPGLRLEGFEIPPRFLIHARYSDNWPIRTETLVPPRGNQLISMSCLENI